ncbi:DNA topoisomerase IV, alpha subunit [Sistotremastrum suecicum HHB10207 ss-3]|uniref:DNA topoisomerase (ATP-hydrolyzing) n=1 Tax=Sistotremastrum suecicum HHB10207 ss-3 TaxID=1314776 RepID=A0A166IE17_9AGAM|nr:DNA topoisomerase IV, alpha subunit [Sistotremastrum suecicum HHB10207 ss-3]
MGVPTTKRDIYYKNLALYKNQSIVDNLLDNIAAALDLTRSHLNVRASPKGLFCGECLTMTLCDGTIIYGNNREGTLIPCSEDIESLQLDEATSWILVVEKEAVFQTLCKIGFVNHESLPGPGVLITGRGYPDVSTRELVHRLTEWVPDEIPCFMLVDADPHGMDILSLYRFGSQRMKHEAENLVSPKLRWIGLRASELTSFGIDRSKLIPLSEQDHKKAMSMLQRPLETMPQKWRKELSNMVHLRYKAEIEILCEAAPADEGKSLTRDQSPDEEMSDADESERLGSEHTRSTIPLHDYLLEKIWHRKNRIAGIS